MYIDSHLHFWKYKANERNWITDDMPLLQKDYLPADVDSSFQQYGIEGCVAVQSRNDEAENDFLFQLAEANTFIKGVVFWTDIQANDLEQKLVYYRRNHLVKGFRHIPQANDAMMIQPSFKSGIELLSKNGFTYDILVDMEQLRYAYQLAAQLPNQKFVIDHMGKPPIGVGNIADWKRNISAFAPLQNVYCKIPGISLETKNDTLKPEEVTPYLDTAVETFGTQRLMYASNWPVSLLKADYDTTFRIASSYFESFSADEKEQVFGKNAKTFYNL